MGISEKKMKIVIDNYFKAECNINTSIKDAFEKGFRIGVNKGLSAQPEQRWIPVTERLPDKDGDYLVTYESGYAEDYGFGLIGIAPFEVDCEGFGIWQEHFHPISLGSLGSDWVEIHVIAWMPLPEPYTEEES